MKNWKQTGTLLAQLTSFPVNNDYAISVLLLAYKLKIWMYFDALRFMEKIISNQYISNFHICTQIPCIKHAVSSKNM